MTAAAMPVSVTATEPSNTSVTGTVKDLRVAPGSPARAGGVVCEITG